ncbi:MAG TPA: acylphosphatase [Chitinophagaceae bacterium]
MLKTVSIIVTGKVQGVFYRQSTREKATASGITGEIKNMPDDTVHIVATGSPEQIEQFIEWCRQGPPKAKVTNVFIAVLPLQSFEKFSIVR